MRQSEVKYPISVELPQRLQAWFAEHEERLQSCGITGAVQQSPEDGRTKNSTWMTLENDDFVAVLIVWSSRKPASSTGTWQQARSDNSTGISAPSRTSSTPSRPSTNGSA